MIIKLFEIEDIFTLKGEMEGFKPGKDYRISSPLHYELSLKRSKDRIKVKGLIECVVSLTCSRCLDEFGYLINARFDLDLVSQAKAPVMQEIELKRDEMDVYYYEGEELELEPLINEEIMLNIPIKPLCRESCKGLCSVCGKNLNYEQCHCNRDLDTLLGEKLKNFLTQ